LSAPRSPSIDRRAPRDPGATLVLGVLGGIGSGKSLAARTLAGPKGRVLSADAIVHEVLRTEELAGLVRTRFGPECLGLDGYPDRQRLAERIFASGEGAALRRELECWTHPRVRDRIKSDLGEARARGVPRVVLDVPLLLENDHEHGLVAHCDALVFVDARLAERDERARASRGWPSGEVARREALQLPLAEKRRRAQFVIENHGSIADLERAAREVLKRLGAA
jgi:dephospho-CoA kinase